MNKEVVWELTEDEKSAMLKDRLRQLGVRGNTARSKRRQENLAKIVEHLKQHGYVTNNEVEELCRIKDSTATRHLKELERQGLVIQFGLKGRRLRWRLRQAT